MDADQRARQIVDVMGGHWHGSYGMVCCPAHDDHNPSLQITPGKKAVLVKCWAGCDRQDVLAAMRRQQIDGRTNGEAHEPPPRRSNRQLALSIWEAAKPIAGTPAETYLRSRAINPIGHKLRYTPRCIVGAGEEREIHHALLIPFESDEGIISLQRILIDPQTGRKIRHGATGESKMALGLIRHAAMRIDGLPADGVLRLAEGYEEAVSVTQLSGGRFKVWGAGGIERYGLISIPDSVRKVVIYSQHGDEAAGAIERSREHLTANNRELKIILPPGREDQDWNDLLQEKAEFLPEGQSCDVPEIPTNDPNFQQ